MTALLQQIVEGLGSGAIYASLALALVLIYRATHVVNFALGEMATFCAFVCLQIHVWGVPLYLAVALTAALSFGLGALVFRLVIQPILDAPHETSTVSLIGLFMFFMSLCLWIWGADTAQFPRLFSNSFWTIGDIRIGANTVGILVTLAILAIALGLLFKLTRLGLAMRAAAAERSNSPYVGINVSRMLMFGWGLAGVFGFLAAAFAAPSMFLSPGMMVSVIIYALAAATLGGWDSPIGAIIGGLAVGIAESVGTTMIGSIGAELRLAIPFLFITAVLLVRPQGLFGRLNVTRV